MDAAVGDVLCLRVEPVDKTPVSACKGGGELSVCAAQMREEPAFDSRSLKDLPNLFGFRASVAVAGSRPIGNSQTGHHDSRQEECVQPFRGAS